MSDLSALWATLGRGARWSLALGVAVIIVGLAAAAYWVLRTPYGVLFSDLADRDAAVMVQELDKLKVPYQFGAEGTSLLVPENRVHKTRLALMAKPLPLHGTVGLELFNNADFGVSDYVQKINFLRAIQGELTRTILSIEQIESARVHLALPEQGLFRKEQQKAKASVTVVMKPGQALAPAQVMGIQRLVSASVAEVNPEDVTVLDQHGSPLSSPADAEGGPGGAIFNTRVDLENHLARKATQVLGQWLGSGEALVSVTANLSNQQARVTKEEILPASPAQGDQLAAGVLVRERNVTREGPVAEAGAKSSGGSTSIDRDYASGKRVEQTNTPAGALTRLHVAVVVRRALGDAELLRARELVAAAVGLQTERGDVLAIHAVDSLSQAGLPAASLTTGGKHDAVASPGEQLSPASSATARTPLVPRPASALMPIINVPSALALILGLVMMLVALALVVRWRNTKSAPSATAPTTRELDAQEREALLRQLRQWLNPSEGNNPEALR
jgi:flagellar M-ring protein FliF